MRQCLTVLLPPPLQTEEAAELEGEQPPEYSLGDLVWVALRGYPLWPAIVVLDKLTGLHTKIDGQLGYWAQGLIKA